MYSYLKCSEELIVADRSVSVSVKVLQKLLSLFLGEVESIVDEAPSKVFNVELTVTVIVHV